MIKLLPNRGTRCRRQRAAFNLNLKLGVLIDNGKGVQIWSGNDVLASFSSDCYDVVAAFKPGSGIRKVGFMFRANGDEGAEVSYDLTTHACIKLVTKNVGKMNLLCPYQ